MPDKSQRSDIKETTNLTNFGVGSLLEHLLVGHDPDALFEPVAVGLLQLVLHEDDGVHLGRLGEDLAELGQQVVGGDHGGNFSLVDAVRDRLVAQRCVYRHH